MTSRERVRRTLEFDSPDRVPRDLWLLPIAILEHGPDAVKTFQCTWPTDFAFPGVSNPPLEARCRGNQYATGAFRDEWGCVWDSVQAGIVGEIKMPMIDEWSKLDDLRVPSEALEIDVDAINQYCAASDRFVLPDRPVNLFERVQFLRGTENVMIDLAEQSSDLMQLIHLVHNFNVREMLTWVKTDIDAVKVFDDWGSQKGMLINPVQWRSVFKPLYAEYASIAHDHGKKLFMHSDGHIFDIYEDLIEIGIDAVNTQLFCMDIEKIAQRFKGRITFWGEIDRQHILPFGTVEEARASVTRVVNCLHDPTGGVIAQFELGCAAKLQNAEAIMQTWEDLTRIQQPS